MLLLVVLVSHFVVVFCATLSQFPSQKETVEAWIWNRKWDKMRETIEGWETWLKGIENENRLLPNSKPLYGPKWAKSRPWSPDSRRDEIIFCYVIFVCEPWVYGWVGRFLMDMPLPKVLSLQWCRRVWDNQMKTGHCELNIHVDNVFGVVVIVVIVNMWVAKSIHAYLNHGDSSAMARLSQTRQGREEKNCFHRHQRTMVRISESPQLSKFLRYNAGLLFIYFVTSFFIIIQCFSVSLCPLFQELS